MAAGETVRLPLGARSYAIHVVADGLEGLGMALGEVFAPGPCVLVTNPVVASLYGDPAEASLRRAGFAPRRLLVPDGEGAKTTAEWANLVERLLDVPVDRRTPLLALGGGVTGDLAGFAAATALRGIPFVQVPTSLLAMVDASVGGKTGVNSPRGKNLVGAFHQPRMVYAATRVLETLPDAEWRSGMGEVVKYALIGDADLLRWMEAHIDALGRRDPAALTTLVARCVAAKAAIVADDEREDGRRAVLNFGHTVGHAVETALGYGHLRHGEAVALGMVAETRFAIRRGWCEEPDLLRRLVALLRALGLPVVLPDPGPGVRSDLFPTLLRAARMDKKAARGTLTLVAPVRLGIARLERVPVEDVAGLLADLDILLEEP